MKIAVLIRGEEEDGLGVLEAWLGGSKLILFTPGDIANWLGNYLLLISLELVTTVQFLEGRKKIRLMIVIDEFSKRTFGESDVVVCAHVCSILHFFLM